MPDSHDKLKPEEKNGGVSRRSFLKGLGVTSAGIATSSKTELIAKLREVPASQGKLLKGDAVSITLNVNGKNMETMIEPRMTLADAIRDHLNLTGTKIGCDRGACGACTVILDGKTVSSCMTLAIDAVGKKIETIEGLSPEGKLAEIQEAFIEHDGYQCGFCTSGMIISSKNLLDHSPNPSLEEIKKATAGNLCRCGTYPKVFESVLAATKK